MVDRAREAKGYGDHFGVDGLCWDFVGDLAMNDKPLSGGPLLGFQALPRTENELGDCSVKSAQPSLPHERKHE